MARVLHVVQEVPGYGQFALVVDGEELYFGEKPVPYWVWMDAIRRIDPTGTARTTQAREAIQEIVWERAQIARGKP